MELHKRLLTMDCSPTKKNKIPMCKPLKKKVYHKALENVLNSFKGDFESSPENPLNMQRINLNQMVYNVKLGIMTSIRKLEV